MKHAFTIDLEDWYHGIELPLSEWTGKENRVEVGLNKVLSLLERHDTKATFFTLGWIAEHYPFIVKRVADAGHEIACHSYEHEKVYDQSPDDFRADTLKAKRLLEDVSGKEVTGFRAPYFSITKRSIWGLDILAELGFTYDCSISPIVTWRYGIANSPNHIYRFDKLDIIEFPLTDFSFLTRKWGTGGAYFRIFPYNALKKAVLAYEKNEQPFMFYAHPWEYDPEHPRVRMERKAQFTHYHNLNKMEKRTERLLQDFRFGTVAEILAEQTAGTKSLASLSIKDLIS